MKLSLLAVGLATFAFSLSAQAVVVPGAWTSLDAPSDNCIPLSGCLDRDRYQQVYGASEFSGPITISQIAFRREDIFGPFSFSLSDVQIALSTTSAGPDALSATFADNQGADLTVVHSGPLTIASASSGGTGVLPFDIIINLSTPFSYDPLLGNLLLDWWNFGSESASPFFGVDSVFDPVSPLVAFPGTDAVSRVYATGVSALTAESIDTGGLVTEFREVPEPASLALLGIGVAGLGFARKKKAH